MGGELTGIGIDLRADEHKEVVRLLQHHLPDTEVWAYGSRVKGAARPASDLDLVTFASAGQNEAVSRLREAFDESPLPFRVDLFVWDKVPEEFLKNIEETRVVVQKEKTGCKLPEGWQETTIGEFCPFSYGKNLPKKVRDSLGGVPVFGSNGVVGHHSKPLIQDRGIIIGRKGTVGTVTFSSVPFWPIDTTFYISEDSHRDLRYTFYLLKSLRMEHMNADSAVPGLNRNAAHARKITIPPLPQQKAIAHILGSLDDKIELNRRMNETLEAMAQALFKSWFVDFDPVIDNALAAGNAIPDKLKEKAAIRQGPDDKRKSLPNDIRRLFPSEFAYTEEMGWVPKGWETQSLYEIATFINGAAYKNFDFTDEPEALPIVKIAEIKNGISSQTKFTKTILADRYRISNGDILFSWSGNPDTSIDTFIWAGGDAWLNQHIFKVLLNNNQEKSFVYYQLRLLKTKFAEIARNKQTTGLGHVTAQDMKNMYITKCPSVILSLFNNSADLLLNRYYLNLMGIKNQSKIQDALLSRLLSGEIRLREAERAVEVVI